MVEEELENAPDLRRPIQEMMGEGRGQSEQGWVKQGVKGWLHHRVQDPDVEEGGKGKMRNLYTCNH
jgi:hypothetical protein